jgi:HD-like signal output (HDOD) protein
MSGALVWILIAVALAAAVSLGVLVKSPRRPEVRPAGRPAAKPAATTAQAPPAPAYGRPQPTHADTPQSIDTDEVFIRLHELAFGRVGDQTLLLAEHEAIAAQTIAALDDAATQQRYSPRRPNMLPRLMNAAGDERVSRRELASIIARDPSLVGSLLKIANSSFYRSTPEPVESVERAVVLLGTDGIRSMIAAALMQPIFRIAGANFPRFPQITWEHTLHSASAAVPYTVVVERADPFTAELLSLVMGLAGIVIFRVALDRYATDLRLRPNSGVIASLLDSQSARVARRIGASWELSEGTLAALDDQPEDVTWAPLSPTNHPLPLGRAIRFGRIAGALAVLHGNRLVDSQTAMAYLAQHRLPSPHLERMWERLTAKLSL